MQARVDLDHLVRAITRSIASGSADPGAHAARGAAPAGTRTDGALQIRPHERRSAATSDVSSEVMVGGIKTACVSRASDGPRMMLADCLAARRERAQRPSWSSPPTAMPSRWPRHDAKFRQDVRSGRHHPCRRPGGGVRLAAADAARRSPSAAPPPISSMTRRRWPRASMACASSCSARPRKPTPRCAEILHETYPGLQIVGRRHGYFEPRATKTEICDEINRSSPT